MNLNFKEQGQDLVVHLDGCCTYPGAITVLREIERALPRYRSCAIDLINVHTVDSYGLDILDLIGAMAQCDGKSVDFINIPAKLRSRFKAIGVLCNNRISTTGSGLSGLPQ